MIVVEPVKMHTTLPVPRKLDWSEDRSNPIGAEYIIMEHLEGVLLHERWSTMTPHQHMLCVKALSMTLKEMGAISFPGYWSLYFSDAPIDPQLKLEFVDGFCLGPHCGVTYWDCSTDEAKFDGNKVHNQGPCQSFLLSFRPNLPSAIEAHGHKI